MHLYMLGYLNCPASFNLWNHLILSHLYNINNCLTQHKCIMRSERKAKQLINRWIKIIKNNGKLILKIARARVNASRTQTTKSPCTLINPAAVTTHRHFFTKQSLEKRGWKEGKSERKTEKEGDSKGAKRGGKMREGCSLVSQFKK